MGLPPVGVRLVAENYAGWQKAMDAVTKRINEAGDSAEKTSKKADPLTRAFDTIKKTLNSGGKSDGFSDGILKGIDAIEKGAGKFKENIVGFFSGKGAAGDAVAGFVGQLDAIPLAATVATVAIAAVTAGVIALAAGFLELGNRGAPLIGLGRAFDNITASVGLTSQALLIDLRKASAGTISDFKLIETANIALTGASGDLGKELGKNLPRLLEIARTQAKVTGKDVDFLFNSIVEGIRKTSPLRIDNAGLIIKTGKAEEAYAASIGKTVDQLTVEQKGIAVLNATLEAGNAALEQSGNLAETNAEKQARGAATITNIFDSLAVAMQPAFGTLLDLQNRFLSIFQQIAEALAPILGAIASIVTTVFSHIFNIVLTITEPIKNAILSFAPYISIAFQAVANIFAKVSEVIQNVVGGIVRFIQDVAQHLFGIDINNLGKNLFEGAAHIFGAFANGIINAANALIFPAVIGIAQFIADLLVGFSPPKKGPLSEIDKGGFNVMSAWLDGITGVSLDPVSDVAAQVDAALGEVGKASLPAVNARLAQLDAALLPFQNRLDIVKSQFDAISAPAQAALDAIDRQLEAADAALASGDQAAAERIRQLDIARESIQGQLDAQQKIVDQQQIQLGLAQANQAQERALLSIRKAALEATQRPGGSAATTTAAGATKEKEKKGEAAPLPAAPEGAPIGISTQGSVLDLFGGQQAVNDAIAGIQDSFASEIDTSSLATFTDNSAKLQTQLNRIGSVDLGAKLKDKFKGLTDLFDASVENSPANVVSRFFSSDPSVPGSFASFTSGLSNIDLHAVGETVGKALADVFIFFTGEGEGTLNGIMSTVTGDATVPGSIANFFSLLPDRVSEAASGLFDKLQTDVFQPVTDFLTGEGPGTMSAVIDGVVQFFTDLPSRIAAALTSIGATIYAALILPIVTAINGLIASVENGIKGFITGIANFVLGIAEGIESVNLGIDTSGIRNIVNDLNSKAAGIAFGRIPIATDIPAPAAKYGGIFGPGAINVGEEGPERIFAADKIGVLPASLTQALDGLSSILAQPAPMMIPSGNTYNNSDNSTWTNNFYGVSDSQGVMRRLSLMRARRG